MRASGGCNFGVLRTSNHLMPGLTDLKETCLYVDDLPRAKAFYQQVLGLTLLVEDSRFCALDVATRHVLLLFVRRASLEGANLPGGIIPPHDGAGPLHVGFAVEVQELSAWESHLQAHGVQILSQVSWPKGGRSIYFRDPDGHLLELLTPGVWSTY
jgi:catechol 2,3-dioxygenase-like lactoylglutathione lyase family enzyme